MSLVGPLIFCTKCGEMLDLPDSSKHLSCEACGSIYPVEKFGNLSVTSQSTPNAFPSSLRTKKSVVHAAAAKMAAGKQDDGATIKEKCPQCGYDEMKYQTLQLRSADEGATVFYSCIKCNYKFRTNN
ncbi:hypothetical protein CANCADRAFT_121657 [Tortispora caseinolytica NRRL Y-17796]|uniref:DNA-directed RNA polymerase subunit n=1 Tax=Tortispora caseinolytica NRRL Y-17796 TaxID=767744 RepID=A0A1E4THJ8_9ASCO|nr:hypothetical protein CANCADRAFT_121657 [Tortispora caseinolytica NRRL Y-17796]